MLRNRSVALIAVVLVLAADCNSESGGGGGGASVVGGSVMHVRLERAFVAGLRAADGDTIRKTDTVSTNSQGVVDFDIQDKVESCTAFNQSAVAVYPNSPSLIPLMRFEEGRTWCNTDADATIEVQLEAGGRARLLLSDPVFGVEITGDQVVVRVMLGFVQVSSLETDGGLTMLVGPGQQSVVAAQADPTAAAGFLVEELTSLEQQVVPELVKQVPAPSFGPPEAADSPALQSIFDRGSIVVGFDAKADVGDGAGAFIDSFMSFLGQGWEVEPVVRAIEVDGLAALEAGDVDIVVSPSLPESTLSLPFFEDRAGQVWALAVRPGEEVFQQALADFLRASLRADEYGLRYRGAFDGAEPAYGSLDSLLGF